MLKICIVLPDGTIISGNVLHCCFTQQDLSAQFRVTPFKSSFIMNTAQAVFLVQVGFWDITSTQPTNEYLDTLSDVLASGLQWMIVLTVPTKVSSGWALPANAQCADLMRAGNISVKFRLGG